MRFALIEAFGVTASANPTHATSSTTQTGYAWCNTSAIVPGTSPANAVAQFLGVPEAHLGTSPWGPAATMVTRHTGPGTDLSGHDICVLVVPL